MHIGNAAAQIAPAVAIEVNGTFIVVIGEELRLADFAGPGAAHFIGVQIATLDKLKGCHQLRAEFFRPAGNPRPGWQGTAPSAGRPILAPKSVSRAQKATITGAGTPNCFLDAGKDGLVFLDQFRPVLDAVIGDHAGLEFKKALGEDILGPVLLDDAGVVGDAIENGKRLAAYALGGCLLVKGLDESRKSQSHCFRSRGLGLISGQRKTALAQSTAHKSFDFNIPKLPNFLSGYSSLESKSRPCLMAAMQLSTD